MASILFHKAENSYKKNIKTFIVIKPHLMYVQNQEGFIKPNLRKRSGVSHREGEMNRGTV